MDQPAPFSRRTGLLPQDAVITIRHEAPGWLRDLVITLADDAGLGVGDLRQILCSLLLESPDPNNWSPGNIEWEVRSLIRNAEWFYVYDLIELIVEALLKRHLQERLSVFTASLNDAFRRKGVGWQLTEGRIETRGPESFETAIHGAVTATQETGRGVAEKELHESLHGLSKRPSPDITGAIQHAMAALECVLRDVTHDPKPTLGELLKKHPGIVPAPLDAAIAKLWGFTSEQGRHLRENQAPALGEAQLVVGLAGALVTYLIQKFPPPTP